MEMLSAEVQSTARVYHEYWTDKYSFYTETCDAVDMVEVRLAMQARSQSFFVNDQMDMRRLQRANWKFERRATEVEA